MSTATATVLPILADRDRHTGLARGATDIAALVEDYPDAPPLCSLVVEHDLEAPRVLCQLTARRGALTDLLAYADVVVDPIVHVRRYDLSPPFTCVAVHTEIGGSHVHIWTHPDDDELEALWAQCSAQEPPEIGVDATVSLEALRSAAGRTSGQDGGQ